MLYHHHFQPNIYLSINKLILIASRLHINKMQMLSKKRKISKRHIYQTAEKFTL